MNIGARVKKFGVIAWGALAYALTILPRILGALEMLGLTQWKETIVEGIRRGGMAADDYIEQNAGKILHVADIFDSLAAWATERADLFRNIHEEGTKERIPGVDDALTADVLADFVRRLLAVDDTSAIEKAIAGVRPALEIAAAGEIKRDVSQSPTLDA